MKMTKNDWMYKVLDLKLEIAKADDDLNDLRSYLLSDKFQGDSTVQVSDVLRRLEGVELYSTTEPMDHPADPPTKRHYYCVSYGMGLAVSANTGDRYAAYYHSFDSSAERDAYVDGGGDFHTSNDWRESVPASDRELKAAISEGEVITSRA